MTNQSTHICKITTNNDLTLVYRSYHLLADNTRVFLVFFVPDSTLKLVKYVRHTRIYHWQSRSCFMSLTFVCISSKQFVDVQHSIKREAFKTLKRERRNSMMFVSKMYLKYSFKGIVWCEMWTNVLACAGLCCTSCKHDYFPVFRSQQKLYTLDMTQGMVLKVTEKESSQQYWCIFPVRQDLAQSIIILSCTCRSDCFFRSSRGFASHRAVRITFSNPARATAHAS